MNSDEELLSMYYNKEEDEKRILDGIIEEEREWAREEGHAIGREEGREEGLKEGRKEGHKEGRAEGIRQAKNETIANLVKLNISIENISKAVNLPIKDVQRIINECNDKK